MIPALVDLIFPRFCHHCDTSIRGKGNLLCPECAGQIELVSALGRCERCFSKKRGPICHICQKRPSLYTRKAALFEPVGPAATLLHLYRQQRFLSLDKTLASYALCQIETLKWEWPDWILYEGSRWGRSCDQRLAYHLGDLMGKRVKAIHSDLGNWLDQSVLILNPKKERWLLPKGLYGLHLMVVD